MAEGTSEPRKSKIKKTITRTFFNKSINIPTYESVTVEVSFEEDVEWNDLEERAKKSENITTLLKMDFGKTVNNIFENYKYKKKVDPVAKELQQKRDDKNKAQNDASLSDMDGLSK